MQNDVSPDVLLEQYRSRAISTEAEARDFLQRIPEHQWSAFNTLARAWFGNQQNLTPSVAQALAPGVEFNQLQPMPSASDLMYYDLLHRKKDLLSEEARKRQGR